MSLMTRTPQEALLSPTASYSQTWDRKGADTGHRHDPFPAEAPLMALEPQQPQQQPQGLVHPASFQEFASRGGCGERDEGAGGKDR